MKTTRKLQKASHSTRGLALLAALFLTGAAWAAEEKPDFTGVYRTYRNPAPAAANPLPLNAMAQEKVAQVEFILEGTGETAGGWCLGSGMPGSMLGSGGYPMEVIQRPEQVTFIYEAHGEIRRVYIGEDNQTPDADKFPDRNGYSRGWWEGDTLVVETTHLKEQLDGRYPHSDQATIMERYSGETVDGVTVLTAQTTVTDPLFYTAPWQTEKKWQLDPEARMLPYECNEPQWTERLEELREQKLNQG